MATSSSYVWRYDLQELTVTTDVTNDYKGVVSTNKSMTISDIAAEIASERTDLREDTIVMAANLIADKITDLVCQGYTVVTGTATYQPSIKGSFTGNTGTWDDDVNSCACTVSSSQSLKDALAEVSAEFTGYVQSAGNARISAVSDATTGATDGTVTAEGIITVTGSKIKVTGDGSGLWLSPAGDDGEYDEDNGGIEVTVFATNDPSKLIFALPSDVTLGSYYIVIKTLYSKSNTLLKSLRTIVSDFTITVTATDDE